MLFLCTLLPWFTAGLFIGAPLSYLHKHYLGPVHAVGPRATLPQFATIHQETVPEYRAREEAVVSSGDVLARTEPLEFEIIVVDFVNSSATLEYDPSETHTSDNGISFSAEWPLAHQNTTTITPLPLGEISTPGSDSVSNEEHGSMQVTEVAETRSNAKIEEPLHDRIDSLARPSPERVSPTETTTPNEETEVNTTESQLKATTLRDMPIPADGCPAMVDTRSEALSVNATLDDELPSPLSTLPVSSEYIMAPSRARRTCIDSTLPDQAFTTNPFLNVSANIASYPSACKVSFSVSRL